MRTTPSLQILYILFYFFINIYLSSCEAAPPSPAPAYVRKGLVILDAGHGGYDLGAHNQFCEEKVIALKTTMLVKKYLQDKGYRVRLSRQDDTFIPLKERALHANRIHAKVFVSIHYNAARNPSAHGIEVFYYDKNLDWRMHSSKRLASCILSRLLDKTHAASRGIKGGNFLVIRETSMPAILIEAGFITNHEECKKLKDPSYINCIARAIADGIDKFCTSH